MRCPSIYQLVEYLDGLCGLSQQAHLTQHIQGCSRCQQEINTVQRTMQLVEAMPKPQMPMDLWPGIATRLTTLPQRTVRPWVWRTMTGVGLVASLLVGMLMLRRPEPPTSVATVTAASYVSQHQLLSARDPLTDRASLGVMLATYQGSR